MIHADSAPRSLAAEREFAERRRQMVSDQLRRRDITDTRVLSAMLRTPREEFVTPPRQGEAYEDTALPIECGQTISQPYTVAYMLQALQLEGTENVLEIGSGSGYGAAVLSYLARVVHTVERIPQLAERARLVLERLGYRNVFVHLADGTIGLPANAPYDAIVVTAGAKSLPESLEQQLAAGGRLVIPIGDPLSQTLFRFTRRGARLVAEDLGQFVFVPLVGQHGWRLPR